MIPPDARTGAEPDEVLDHARRADPRGRRRPRPGLLRRRAAPLHDRDAARARRGGDPARAPGGRARPAAARHLPRHAAARRRVRRDAGPAPARRRRPRRPPAPARLVRRRRPRRPARRGIARRAGVRRARAQHQVAPPPGRRPARRRARGERLERARRPRRGDRDAGRALGARRAVAPRGGPALGRGRRVGRQRSSRQRRSFRLPACLASACGDVRLAAAVRLSTAIKRGSGRGARRRRGGAAGPPPSQASRARRHRGGRVRAVRALRAPPAHPCARRRHVRAADVGVPRDVQDAQRRPRGARAPGEDRLPGARSTASSAPARRRRCGSSGCSAGRAASARGRRCSSVSHWIWFRSRTGPSRTCSGATRSASPRGRRRSTRRSTSDSIGYWAIPTAPPWYAAQKGLMDDGITPELRRMMVEYGEHVLGFRVGASVRSPGRQSPGRHALAALRHLRHGRPPAGRDGTRRRRDRVGVRRHARRRARLPGRALRHRPRGRPRARRGHPPRRRPPRAAADARVGRRPGAGGAGARHDQRRPRTRRSIRSRRRTTTTRGAPGAPDHRAQRWSRIAAFLLLALAALYFLLPQLAGLDDTWNRIEDGRPAWTIAALFFTVRHVRSATSRCSAASTSARPTRIGWAASYQITMAGLAASRLFAAGGAGGLVLTAWALRALGHAQARPSPTRRSRSSC